MSELQDKIKQVSSLSFEQAFSELEIIVNKLESGKESLENLMGAFEYGNLLKEHCEKILGDAKLKVDKIVQKGEKVELEPFDQD